MTWTESRADSPQDRRIVRHVPKRAARLYRDIVTAGATAGRIRGLLVGLGFTGVAVLMGIGGILWVLVGGRGEEPVWLAWILIPTALIGIFLLVAALLVLPAVALYRTRRRDQFRRQLEELPREERAAVLLSLQNYQCDNTQAIVRPLINHFHPAGSELAPSASPEGTGREVATGERDE